VHPGILSSFYFTYSLQINLFKNNESQKLNDVLPIMLHKKESLAVWAFYPLGVPNWNWTTTTENQLDN
jgi:hypothetical protein